VRTKSVKKKEMETIPEVIAIDDVVAATPAKSVKKSAKKTPAKSVKKAKEAETIPEAVATVDGEVVDIVVAATPSKSAKKSAKKTPDQSARETKEVETISEAVATGDAVVAATPSKSAKKKAKKTPAKLEKEVETISEAAATAADNNDVGENDAVVATPSKSSKKKEKKAKKTPVKSPKKTEEAEAITEVVSTLEDGNGEVVEEAVVGTPAKSAKKKSKKTPAKSSKETEESEPVSEVPSAAVDGEVVEEAVVGTPAKSAKKKAKKTPAKPANQNNAKESDFKATPTETKKSKDFESPSTPNSTETPMDANKESISQESTSRKSSKKKKKKRKRSNEAAESSDPSETPGPDLADKSGTSKSARKRALKSNLDDSKVGPMDSSGETTSTETSKKKKMKMKVKESTSSHSEEGASTPKVSEKTSKNSLKRLHKSEPEEKKEEPLKDTKSSKKKKKKQHKGAFDAKVTDSAAEKPSKGEDVASSKENTSKKANVDAPEIKVKLDQSPKRKTPKSKKGDKSPNRKQLSAHKKQQSRKHGRPASSVSPIKGHSKLSSQVKTAPPKLVMDVKVHRLRFLKLHPKSIMAMASTPLDSFTDSTNQQPRPPGRLAISREGGSVELLSPHDRWVSVGDVPGVRGREVDALVWVCGRRQKDEEETRSQLSNPSSLSSQKHHARSVDEQRHLFGCSRDGTIFELDFAKKRQKGVIGSGGGGVFCLASMYSHGKWSSSKGRKTCGGYFAAGCEDGTVKIYSAFDSSGERTASGMPELVATLPSAGDAILSLTWVPGQSGNDDGGMGGSVIFAGVADGTIRRYDCTTAIVTGPISTGTVLAPSRGSTSISYRWKSTLRMTVENRGLREATKVWALQALSDGTVISGDSLGHIQVWDGLSGTMTQTFDHNESGADVLCLAVSEDENKIFASGVDSSVRCIQRQCLPSAEAGDKSPQDVMLEAAPIRNWISSTSHRKHSHDVKALAICHKNTSSSKPIELLVSGSVDTRICTYVTKDFKSSRPKIWYNWPTLSPISLSPQHRLLAVTRDDSIDLFQLSGPEMAAPAKNVTPESRDETRSLVKTISIQSPFNLNCSVISDDGKFLAASDAVSLYVFSLEVEGDDGKLEDVHPTKLSLPVDCRHPGTALKFDNRGRLFCATNNGLINILQINPVSKADSSDGDCYKVSLEHVFKEHVVDWSASSYHFPIVCLDLSTDGKWLAAGRFSSGKGAVNVFALATNEDGRYKHWWSLPEMDAPTTCIKFLGGGSVESSLAVGCSSNEFYIYNLDRRSLSHWSNDMGLPLLKSLPKELTSRSEPVARIVSNPVNPQRFILGSHGYFCTVDLDQPVPEQSSMFPPDHLRAKRLELLKEEDAMMYCLPLKKKSKSSASGNGSTNLAICLRYSEILFQDFIAENEMVIVEEPWMSILSELPDTLARRVYGT